MGKTALIEGLAQRIANKDVPRSLENKVIRILDLRIIACWCQVSWRI